MRPVSFRTAALISALVLACVGESDSIGQSTPDRTEAHVFLGPPVEPGQLPASPWERDPSLRWSLVEELRIGEVNGEGPDVFGYIRNLVPSHEGGVWVFDQQAYELRRFDRNGQFLATVGRQGEGPGEFTGNACAREGVGHEVWVETETNWHRYDGDGEFLGTFRSPATGACAVKSWVDQARYLVFHSQTDWETRVRTQVLMLLEWSGSDFAILDTIQLPEVEPNDRTVVLTANEGRSRSTQPVPFTHPAGARMLTDGSFVVWQGQGDYAFHHVSFSGDTLAAFSRAYVPASVPADIRRQAIDGLRRPGWVAEPPIGSLDIPTTYPPFTHARSAPDGSIWVSRDTERGLVRDIFTSDGTFLGELEIPQSLDGVSIQHIGENVVWGVVRDDFDVQYVVRARIVRPTR